ncbi:MAG TPA: aspartate-semialdehyde dehydrogenase [Bacteroidales bacterium]|nr:aspartate-semialdehyde dehydrogenase [Bacteroidales bacterium]
MKIAIVGATGLVGSVMVKVLNEGKYISPSSIESIIPVASEKSVGKEISFKNSMYKVCNIQDALKQKPDIALFSAGSEVSKEYARQFTKGGCVVIDNSSAWRMEEDIPLVVTEVNGDVITASHKLIANPNCSTIQLVVALAPLHEKYHIKRVVVSTYQSVTGTGAKALTQLMQERQGISGVKVYPHPIDMNVLPHGGTFTSTGYTTEEVKLVNETRKIMRDQSIALTATVVRVPVTGGHSESVNIEFEKPFELDDVLSVLSKSKGIVIQDDIDRAVYPMPLYTEGRDEVFVGRIRRDESVANGLNMWVVSDNLRKGAATNAVQIAALMLEKEFIKV